MATMTHRTAFALDEDTIRKLRILSARWKISLAEAVRRAVAQAEAQAQDQKPNPVEMLRELHNSGQSRDPERAEAYLARSTKTESTGEAAGILPRQVRQNAYRRL